MSDPSADLDHLSQADRNALLVDIVLGAMERIGLDTNQALVALGVAVVKVLNLNAGTVLDLELHLSITRALFAAVGSAPVEICRGRMH